MAIALRRPNHLDLPLIQKRVGRLVRIAVWTWIVLNTLTWAPTTDAKGNCNCPICNPFGLRGSK